MFSSLFDYRLPPECIAQSPVEPRDHSRMMTLDRHRKILQDEHFYDITRHTRPGDLLVWNNSRVFKARLSGFLLSPKGEILREHKKPIEIFLVRPMENPGVWKVLAKPGRHVRPDSRIIFAEDFYCEVLLKEPEGSILVQFPYEEAEVRAKANIYGQVPLPPYIKDEKHELEVYQTCYSDKDKEGSVAAPTAGFHFTPSLIKKLKSQGVEFAEVTLHVGLGTFLPVKTERIEDHTMHGEWAELTQVNADKINKAKQEGRRVIAVGSTSTRTLEGIASLAGYADKRFEVFNGDIDLFIKPGFQFKVVDALISNFHLPKSTLLMLVAAFVGDREYMLYSYQEAIHKGYRFYSFGDAMFIY
ncbi:MAG: tRNA preQ1(34) S-adenosylmethionine ribosyltransferase-isomerase QueA [Candidatus Magasanikbacteria bacterium]|nr:tRNA preQ1(34) S-adenosylmethionine ribosyltransferase-isomerase QueA [Candidatus Magasanikbacteria bacterium]